MPYIAPELQANTYSREHISGFNSQSLSLTTSSVSSVGSVMLSTGLSSQASAAASLSTVTSNNLSLAVSRDTSQSVILSTTTSTANSG